MAGRGAAGAELTGLRIGCRRAEGGRGPTAAATRPPEQPAGPGLHCYPPCHWNRSRNGSEAAALPASAGGPGRD
eukprot:1845062-Lingulodinium_polyedra.AAC.1